MRILWLTNIPIGKAGELFFGEKSSGLWMDAALEEFIGNTDAELFVVTTGQVDSARSQNDGRVTYYLLPDKIGYEYECGKKANLAAIKKMLDEVAPDIIQIWGTENQVAMDLLESNGGKAPVVVYIQGVVSSLERYFKAGISTKDILLNYTPMDIVGRMGIYQQMRRYRNQAKREVLVVEKSGNIIGENLWSKAYYKSIYSDVNFYACPLHINRSFAEHCWNADGIVPYSIMCNSSNYSIKGLHILLEAIYIVKQRYPEVKLWLPGNNPAADGSFSAGLRRSGYIKYIRKLIKKLDLESSIEFLPFLSPMQMAEKMARSNAFVMSSAIENHSSSLKEAMLVGTPSIGTYVGGISEYVRHGENGFIYRFEEPEVLAELICRIFESKELAQRLSENARADMMDMHVHYDIHARLMEIYKNIIEADKK